MFDAPEPDAILHALGDKVVHGLSRAVMLGRNDLADYRDPTRLGRLQLRARPRQLDS